MTSYAHTEDHKFINLGVAAHITAAAPGGPRYDNSLSPTQRKAAANAIWLCQTCAKLIDNDEVRYTVETLRTWKEKAEEEQRRRVKTATATRGELVMVGLDVAFYAQCEAHSDAEWVFSSPNYIIGDSSLLARYSERFYFLHDRFQTVAFNAIGSGRIIIEPPRVQRDGVHILIEKPARHSFPTIALSGGDIDLEAGEVHGADATHAQLEYALSSPLGWPLAPQVGSQMERFLTFSEPKVFSDLVKAEIIRLSVYSVPSILWVGSVCATRPSDTAHAIAIQYKADDFSRTKIDRELHVFASGEYPSEFDSYDLRADKTDVALGSQAHVSLADLVLGVLQTHADDTRVDVRLETAIATIGPARYGRDLRIVLQQLVARGDISDLAYNDGGDSIVCRLRSPSTF